VGDDIKHIETSLAEVKETLKGVVDALERLARLEERHMNTARSLERAFTAITKLETRIADLEKKSPIQSLASGWVINTVWLVVGGSMALVVKSAWGG